MFTLILKSKKVNNVYTNFEKQKSKQTKKEDNLSHCFCDQTVNSQIVAAPVLY